MIGRWTSSWKILLSKRSNTRHVPTLFGAAGDTVTAPDTAAAASSDIGRRGPAAVARLLPLPPRGVDHRPVRFSFTSDARNRPHDGSTQQAAAARARVLRAAGADRARAPGRDVAPGLHGRGPDRGRRRPARAQPPGRRVRAAGRPGAGGRRAPAAHAGPRIAAAGHGRARRPGGHGLSHVHAQRLGRRRPHRRAHAGPPGDGAGRGRGRARGRAPQPLRAAGHPGRVLHRSGGRGRRAHAAAGRPRGHRGGRRCSRSRPTAAR